MCADLGLADHHLPAVPRLRGDAGAAAPPQPRPRRAQVRRHAGARHRPACWSAATSSPPRCDDDERAAADLREMASAPHAAACASATRRWPGAGSQRLWRHAWDIVRQADHPALGLILDSFHTLSRGDDLGGHRRPCRPRSCSSCSWPTRRSCRWTCCPGAGISAISPARASCRSAGFLRDVLAAGYRGPLSLEVFNDEFRAAPSRLIARDGLRADPAGGGGGRRRHRCRARRRVDGFEFLEFAVDDAGARRARRTARHARLPPRRAAPLQSPSSCIARAASTSC